MADHCKEWKEFSQLLQRECYSEKTVESVFDLPSTSNLSPIKKPGNVSDSLTVNVKNRTFQFIFSDKLNLLQRDKSGGGKNGDVNVGLPIIPLEKVLQPAFLAVDAATESA